MTHDGQTHDGKTLVPAQVRQKLTKGPDAHWLPNDTAQIVSRLNRHP